MGLVIEKVEKGLPNGLTRTVFRILKLPHGQRQVLFRQTRDQFLQEAILLCALLTPIFQICVLQLAVVWQVRCVHGGKKR